MTHRPTDFSELRAREFSRLDAANHAYLDYTGAALYAASQIEAHQRALTQSVYGNPHSTHGPSIHSSVAIDEARAAVLDFFGVDASTHAVCFTANATAAIKLIAEGFAFGPTSPLILSSDNHNSINGIREFAKRASAPITTLPIGDDLRLDDVAARLRNAAPFGSGLFAIPAQSNFSGVQHPLSLVAEAQALGLTVLLDAAAFVPTNPLNLRDVTADFVAVSFYKLFGYPTGVGALVATHAALAQLARPWFAGGTVDFVSVQLDRHQRRRGIDGFEDGTPNYLGIAAVPYGLAFLRRIGLDHVHRHVCTHAHAFLNAISSLTHRNGEPLVEVYGPGCAADRGATIAFNVKDARGRTVPYPQVEERAQQAGVALRGGCFCNPGAAEAAFHFDADRTSSCLNNVGVDFSIERFASCLGDFATVGAVRASFGVPTNARDASRAIDVIASFTN